MMTVLCCRWFLWLRTRIVVFFGDDHGGEAVVGCRDAN